MKKILIAPIRFYKFFISPLLGPRCKYYPSCSQYAIDAIQEHGITGLAYAAWRILRCNPWSHGGVDYVPQRKRKNRGNFIHAVSVEKGVQ